MSSLSISNMMPEMKGYLSGGMLSIISILSSNSSLSASRFFFLRDLDRFLR
jgi:hypothetical protein